MWSHQCDMCNVFSQNQRCEYYVGLTTYILLDSEDIVLAQLTTMVLQTLCTTESGIIQPILLFRGRLAAQPIDHSRHPLPSLIQVLLGTLPALPISLRDFFAEPLDSLVDCVEEFESNIQILHEIDAMR